MIFKTPSYFRTEVHHLLAQVCDCLSVTTATVTARGDF